MESGIARTPEQIVCLLYLDFTEMEMWVTKHIVTSVTMRNTSIQETAIIIDCTIIQVENNFFFFSYCKLSVVIWNFQYGGKIKNRTWHSNLARRYKKSTSELEMRRHKTHNGLLVPRV